MQGCIYFHFGKNMSYWLDGGEIFMFYSEKTRIKSGRGGKGEIFTVLRGKI